MSSAPHGPRLSMDGWMDGWMDGSQPCNEQVRETQTLWTAKYALETAEKEA